MPSPASRKYFFVRVNYYSSSFLFIGTDYLLRPLEKNEIFLKIMFIAVSELYYVSKIRGLGHGFFFFAELLHLVLHRVPEPNQQRKYDDPILAIAYSTMS